MSTSTTTPAPARPGPAAVPYLAVRGAREAIDWYVDVLGAVVEGEPIVMPDGRIGHAELGVGGGVLYLSDEYPEIGVIAPDPAGASVSLMLDVGDADATRARAVAAGASGDRPPYDAYGTRNAWIVDPFGHRWGLQSPVASEPAQLAEAAAQSPARSVAYVSLNVPDTDRAAAFYATVFGWEFAGTHAVGTRLSIGTYAATGRPNLFCCYAVPDLEAAAERVRAAGGTAGEVEVQSFGRVVDCHDDQGVWFALWEDDGAPAAEVELAYLTVETPDSARTRAFYGAVLGWQYTPGHAVDGWNVDATVPMVGIGGGAAQSTAVPMWQVDDIAAAVEAVRAAGGTATEPEQQPYGITSECTDDQGSRFYLGEL